MSIVRQTETVALLRFSDRPSLDRWLADAGRSAWLDRTTLPAAVVVTTIVKVAVLALGRHARHHPPPRRLAEPVNAPTPVTEPRLRS